MLILKDKDVIRIIFIPVSLNKPKDYISSMNGDVFTKEGLVSEFLSNNF